MQEGVVLKSTGSWYIVQGDEKDPIACRIRGKIRLDELKSTNPVAVGDRVLFEVDAQTGEGIIIRLAEPIPTLKELMAQISPINQHEEVDFGRAEGEEIW